MFTRSLQLGIYQKMKASGEYNENNVFFDMVYGSGTPSFDIQIPFEPDVILLMSVDPIAEQNPNTITVYAIDRLCLTKSHVRAINQDGAISGGTIDASIAKSLTEYNNGILSVALTESLSAKFKFNKNAEYIVWAMKHENIRSTIEDQINSIPDDFTGTIKYNSVVYQYFTEAEWNSLIATKPLVTFVIE